MTDVCPFCDRPFEKKVITAEMLKYWIVEGCNCTNCTENRKLLRALEAKP